MNVNSLIASLLAPAQGTATASAGAAAAASSTDSGAQFKAQFGQAIASLTGIVASAQDSGGTSASASAGSTATTAGTATPTDALEAALQKKISDLLAAGNSIQQIVQQLAGALANIFAGQLGGANLAQIQSQLQSTFATALSPTGTGPPASTADLASTLAQRFRQIADLAAGVIGETGQSNRLFAGSFSDAATTAGGQPAPGSTNGNTTADSTASDASALLASLTASQGDGKTVASTAPMIGTNGDTLLGRILARATQASSPVTSTPASESATAAPATAAPAAPTGPAGAASSVVDRAIAAATALLGQSLSTTTGTTAASAPAAAAAPADVLTALASKSFAPANMKTESATESATANGAATTATTATAASDLAPSVSAFVKSFTAALAASSNGVPATADKAQPPDDNGIATVLPTAVASTQAPTIGAFAPVAPALHVDALANAGTNPSLPQQTAMTDPNTVVEQVLRGAFLTTTGNLSTVRLKLVPDSLGDVSVKLSINGSSVDAQVVAQTPAAHDALVAGQAQLTRSLSDAGLKLTSFNVSLAGGGFSSFQQQQQQSAQQQTPSGRPLLLGDVDSSETDDSSLAAIPSYAPPVTAAPTGWGAYNYLV
jgi:flagellar hook-length control protein FliK